MRPSNAQIIALKTCRQKAALVSRLKENLREANAALDGIKSPSTNGMPGGCASSSGAQARMVERRDKLAQQLARAEMDFTQIRTRAETVISLLDVKDDVKLFAQMYYVYALEVDEAAGYIGRSEKTGRRYRETIEGGNES